MMAVGQAAPAAVLISGDDAISGHEPARFDLAQDGVTLRWPLRRIVGVAC